MQKTYIAYTRVSTQKQEAHGVSLQEQRYAITKYAQQHQLRIAVWYEEAVTAGKLGRKEFAKVIKLVNSDRGRTGLLMHKIDRGARNLKDWAVIGELIDQGIDVRFVHDALNLQTRGGRLTADLQAVIAADFIRNLRDEVKKGMQGRLRQGLYPFPSPRGYLDQGGGKVKKPDPVTAPLIVAAFKLYAGGEYTLRTLTDELAILGLCKPSGDAFPTSALSSILRNSFYSGQIKVAGQTYVGKHQPLVSEELFNQVQHILTMRRPRRRIKHHFRYRRQLQCTTCSRCLVGEKQKSHVYYRCTRCRGVCVREDRVFADD